MGGKSSRPSSNSECNFIASYERVKLFSKIIKELICDTRKIPESVVENTSRFLQILNNYQELTMYLRNNDATVKLNELNDRNSTDSAHGDSVFELRNSIRVLQEEMRRVKAGQGYQNYNKNAVLGTQSLLNKVNDLTTKACKVGKECVDLLKKVRSLKHVVLRKEANYQKKRKPLTESKHYIGQNQKFATAERKFEDRRKEFDKLYTQITQSEVFATGRILDSFFESNLTYLGGFLRVAVCVAPDGFHHLEAIARESVALRRRMAVVGGQPLPCLSVDGDGPGGGGGGGGPRDFLPPPAGGPAVYNLTSYVALAEAAREPSTPRTVRVGETNIARVEADPGEEPAPRPPSPGPVWKGGDEAAARASPGSASAILRHLASAPAGRANREPFEPATSPSEYRLATPPPDHAQGRLYVSAPPDNAEASSTSVRIGA